MSNLKSLVTETHYSTIFVGDLSIYCSEKDLFEAFKHFGGIEAVRIKRGGPEKVNLLYGFIKFATKEEAENALKVMNGHILLGRAIR